MQPWWYDELPSWWWWFRAKGLSLQLVVHEMVHFVLQGQEVHAARLEQELERQRVQAAVFGQEGGH